MFKIIEREPFIDLGKNTNQWLPPIEINNFKLILPYFESDRLKKKTLEYVNQIKSMGEIYNGIPIEASLIIKNQKTEKELYVGIFSEEYFDVQFFDGNQFKELPGMDLTQTLSLIESFFNNHSNWNKKQQNNKLPESKILLNRLDENSKKYEQKSDQQIRYALIIVLFSCLAFVLYSILK